MAPEGTTTEPALMNIRPPRGAVVPPSVRVPMPFFAVRPGKTAASLVFNYVCGFASRDTGHQRQPSHGHWPVLIHQLFSDGAYIKAPNDFN